jgi:PufQ cytochrome subunit
VSDQTANGMGQVGPKPVRVPRTEFRLYFTVIFLLAIPVATLGWVASAARHGKLPEKAPIARAWSDAKAITPQIFSA